MHHFRAGDGAQPAFKERGTGDPALVFVHGWQADHTVWNDMIAALSRPAHTVAVDLRGNGESAGIRGPYDLDRFAADLRELIAARAAAPAIVVGHSMGATAALKLAVDAPETVRGLVLVAPVPAGGAGFTGKGADYLRATAGDPEKTRRWLARTFAREPEPRTLDLLCAAAAKSPRDASLESFESWTNADFAEKTRAIAVPAIVVAPAGDTPEMYERKVAALLPHARTVVLDDCAHYAIVERPAAIAALIETLYFMG